MTGWASRRLKKRVRGRPRRPSPGCRLVLLLGLTLSATGCATAEEAGSATEVVPSGFAFRADFRSPFREQILAEMVDLAESPAGRQILLLTQADRIERHPMSCLDSALELLAEHRRAVARSNGSVQVPPGEGRSISIVSQTP